MKGRLNPCGWIILVCSGIARSGWSPYDTCRPREGRPACGRCHQPDARSAEETGHEV